MTVLPSDGDDGDPQTRPHRSWFRPRKYSTFASVCLVFCVTAYRVIAGSRKLSIALEAALSQEPGTAYSDGAFRVHESDAEPTLADLLSSGGVSPTRKPKDGFLARLVEKVKTVSKSSLKVKRMDYDEEFRQNLAQKKQHFKREKGMAGCLLIKDDNDRLAEWVAYHVTTLPMTHLIVAVDPAAVQDPMDVLGKYVEAGILQVELWPSETHCPGCQMLKGPKHRLYNHNTRQFIFANKCIKRHKEWGNTWVTIIDTDEYLVFNRYMDESKWSEEKRKTGVRFRQNRTRFVRGEIIRSDCKAETLLDESVAKRTSRKSLPPTGTSITAMEFIAMHAEEIPFLSPCVTFPRLFFSSIEPDDATLMKHVPENFVKDARNFTTNRFRHHAIKGEHDLNLYGKVIMDASRIYLNFTINIIHRPSKEECNIADPCLDKALFRVHHYQSTYESYSSRKGSWRNAQKFDQGKDVDMGADDDIRPWLQLFVQKFGPSKSADLVDGVGDVKRAFASVTSFN